MWNIQIKYRLLNDPRVVRHMQRPSRRNRDGVAYAGQHEDYLITDLFQNSIEIERLCERKF